MKSPPLSPHPNSAAFHLGCTVGQRAKLQIISLLVPCNQMSCYLDNLYKTSVKSKFSAYIYILFVSLFGN